MKQGDGATRITPQPNSKLGASLPISTFAKAKLGHNPNWNKAKQNAAHQAQQRRFKLNKLKKRLAKQGQLPPHGRRPSPAQVCAVVYGGGGGGGGGHGGGVPIVLSVTVVKNLTSLTTSRRRRMPPPLTRQHTPRMQERSTHSMMMLTVQHNNHISMIARPRHESGHR